MYDKIELTEKDAALAFAIAWNRLDCSEFLTLLDDNAHYASQRVFAELESKEAISHYIQNKMENIKKSRDMKVYAELGRTMGGVVFGSAGKDCVVLAQGEKKNIKAIALFEVANGKIKRYDLCIPDLFSVERTGVYPI